MTNILGKRHNEDDVPTGKTPEIQTPPLANQSVVFETVLGTNSSLEGKLASNGNIRMNGTFNGTLDISANILVGETAEIVADITAKNISIAGTVRGNVTGNKVQLLQTGRIWGDIHATSLIIEEGAFIDGKITMSHEVSELIAEPEREPQVEESDGREQDTDTSDKANGEGDV